MDDKEDFITLSHEEAMLKVLWEDVVKHIRSDLAYIWIDEVRKDFFSIQKESEKIAYVLTKLYFHKRADETLWNKVKSDIKNLFNHLHKMEAKQKWVKIIHGDLLAIIADVELEKKIINAEESKMQVKFHYPDVYELEEPNLPADWNETNIASFGRISHIYSLGIEEEQREKPTSAVTDRIFAQILRDNNYDSILDIGIGDGERLSKIIKKSGIMINGFGTELSDSMIKEAQKRGFEVKKHDLRNPLPFEHGSFDCVAYLTGDFGYLMDTKQGFNLRVAALNSAHSALKPNGTFFAEMISNDTPEQNKDGKVMVYRRLPEINGQIREDLAGTFYIKQFRFTELKKLVEASQFDIAKSRIAYMVRSPGTNMNIRTGEIVANYDAFQGFDLKQIHPNAVFDLSSRTDYRMFLIARK